jgi:hypothetical protein
LLSKFDLCHEEDVSNRFGCNDVDHF